MIYAHTGMIFEEINKWLTFSWKRPIEIDDWFVEQEHVISSDKFSAIIPYCKLV